MCSSCERSAVGVGVVGRCPQYLKPIWVVERFFEVDLYQGTVSVVPQSSLQPCGLYSLLKNSAWGDFEGAQVLLRGTGLLFLSSRVGLQADEILSSISRFFSLWRGGGEP